MVVAVFQPKLSPMTAFIRYPKKANTCLSHSLRSLACTGSFFFGIAAFYCKTDKIGKENHTTKS
jgi:hypothetical protein